MHASSSPSLTCLTFFSPSSSPGRWLESVVSVVLLLSDMWGRADHQDKTLQCSCASTGRQRLWGEWKGDSGLHCRAMSQWVILINPWGLCPLPLHPWQAFKHLYASWLPPRQHSPCVLGWPLFYHSGNVDSNKLSLFPFVALGSTFHKAAYRILTWSVKIFRK